MFFALVVVAISFHGAASLVANVVLFVLRDVPVGVDRSVVMSDVVLDVRVFL